MSNKRLKLKAEKERVYTVNGKYLFSVSMTDRSVDLLNNDGWDSKNESWLSYRTRTESERIDEELKRRQIALDLVKAYNEKYDLQ
jgi:hypothetical protein